MKGENINQDRSNWEVEVFKILYEQKLEDERIRRTTRILEYACVVLITLVIIAVLFINFGY